MKYFLLLTTLLFVTSCATKSQISKLEERVNNISIKETCTRETLELILFLPIAVDPRNFNNEGDFMQAQFIATDMKNKQENSCKIYMELKKSE